MRPKGSLLPFETRELLSVNVSWFCPVNCDYCHVVTKASHRDKTVISKQTLSRESRRARGLGFEDIRFSGGEPVAIGNQLFDLAEIVFDEFGKQPILLTSGYGLNPKWMKKAQGLFSTILVSIENPFSHLQTKLDPSKLLKIIAEYNSDKLVLRQGLTLLTADQFSRIPDIFDYLYDAVNKDHFPQLGYPCHKNFIAPSRKQLNQLEESTSILFERYGYIPFYFTDFIGSFEYTENNARRIVVNLNPDGTYGFFDDLANALEGKIKSELANDRTRRLSPICSACEWHDRCTYHLSELGQICCDWCEIRKALWNGILKGIGKFVLKAENIENSVDSKLAILDLLKSRITEPKDRLVDGLID